MKNIFSKNLKAKKLTFKQKLKLGIVVTLFLEILAFSKASHANSVDDYFEVLPKTEAPSRLEQSSNQQNKSYNSEVILVRSGDGLHISSFSLNDENLEKLVQDNFWVLKNRNL
jgi:hypothetical protein